MLKSTCVDSTWSLSSTLQMINTLCEQHCGTRDKRDTTSRLKDHVLVLEPNVTSSKQLGFWDYWLFPSFSKSC